MRENHRHRGVGDEGLGPVRVLFDVDEGSSILGRRFEKPPAFPFSTLEAPAFPLGPASEADRGWRLTLQRLEEVVPARERLSKGIEAHLDEIGICGGCQTTHQAGLVGGRQADTHLAAATRRPELLGSSGHPRPRHHTTSTEANSEPIQGSIVHRRRHPDPLNRCCHDRPPPRSAARSSVPARRVDSSDRSSP